MTLSAAARRILNEGTLCYLAAPSPAGPHVTPVVFVLDGGRLWGTTGRATTKAKLWRRNPTAGGLVGSGGSWLSFRGPVTLYDALDPTTWGAWVRAAPRVASASARFSMKNARFFAGYARDAARVPLGWTPPGRVIFSVEIASGALIREGDLVERWGRWGRGPAGAESFRRRSRGASGEASPEAPLAQLPAEVRGLVEGGGDGVIALPAREGAVVLSGAWSRSEGDVFVTAPSHLVSLADPIDGSASLVVDRASAWRAAKMRGVLVRGPATLYFPAEMRSGRASLASAAGPISDGAAVIRIRPRSAVWWRGWASGTVSRP